MHPFKTLLTIGALALPFFIVGCHRPAPKVAEAPASSECLQLPEGTLAEDKVAALKLHEEVLELLSKPSDEATMAFNFKLIDAYAVPQQKSLDQLVLIQTLACIQKHHMGKITQETFDRMKLDLIFALAKSMGERDLSVAKKKWEATVFGPQKIAALAELGI